MLRDFLFQAKPLKNSGLQSSLIYSRALSYGCMDSEDLWRTTMINETQCIVVIPITNKVLSSNMSRLEAHAGFFRLLIMEIFGP